jgi:galactonate dehydratase
MALYDLMGRYLEVPVYKLMGRKVRDRVSCAAWTRPCPPDVFAGEIERAVKQGYTIFKMHSDARYDVIEQTRAAEEVAPPGFKIHWDFNHNRTLATVLPIINELERNHPIVGFIEDPLPWSDIDGWRKLRQRTRLPLIMHVPPLGGIQEVMQGVADIFMIGGAIGRSLISGFAYGRANVQTLIQQSGNTLMKALTLHMAAVLPTASAHIIALDDQYDEDITTKIPVMGGFSAVPETPGLGVEVDEEALARAASRHHIPLPEFIGVLHLPGDIKAYSWGSPNVEVLTGKEEGAIPGIAFDYWEDDGSEEFSRIKARLQREGSFVQAT